MARLWGQESASVKVVTSHTPFARLLRETQLGTHPFYSPAALSWPLTFPGDRLERILRQSLTLA